MTNFISKFKEYGKYILIAYILISGGAVGFLAKDSITQRREAERLEHNQEALLMDLEEFKTQSGKDAAKIQQLQLTKKEFEKLCNDQTAIIEDLRLRVKDIQNLYITATKTQVTGKTNLKDTVIIYKTITPTDTLSQVDTAKYFQWKDNWNSVEGYIIKDSVDVSYSGKDTLNIVATKVPKKFLFIEYGVKYLELNVTNSNPSSKITYSKGIRIKKKREK